MAPSRTTMMAPARYDPNTSLPSLETYLVETGRPPLDELSEEDQHWLEISELSAGSVCSLGEAGGSGFSATTTPGGSRATM